MLCLSILLPVIIQADTAIQSIDIQTPRPFGYVIGDRIEHQVRLVLNQPFQLRVEDSFPKPGRINHWLEFYPPMIETETLNNATAYSITLTYQLINITPALTELATPEHKLVYSDGQGRFTKPVPEWRFRYHVLTKQDSAESDLRTDQTPLLLPDRGNIVFWLAALVLLFTVLGFIVIYGRLPFLAYHNGPFAYACRQLKTLQSKTWDEQTYQQALSIIHDAFNRTLQRTVFASELDEFFQERPQFKNLQQPIENYFQHSRRLFFSQSQEKAKPLYSLPALIGLCHDCRDIERGWR